MITQDVDLQMVTLIAVVDLQMVALTMIIVGEVLPETSIIKISLTERESLDQEGSTMTVMIVEEKGAKTKRKFLPTKEANKRRAKIPGQREMPIEMKTTRRITCQLEMRIEIKTTRRITPLIERMKKIKMNVGGVEARIGVKEEGREREAEIRAETRIERKDADAATAKMMTDAIDRKKIGKIKSLKEVKMIKIEEPKNLTETVAAENAKNVAGMRKILVIVNHLAVTIVLRNARRETKERAMAEVLIGTGSLRHPEDSMIRMGILRWPIETEVVNEVETNREMVDMDLVLKTGDLRMQETADQEMGLIGDLRMEEMAAQTIGKGTMIEGDNRLFRVH